MATYHIRPAEALKGEVMVNTAKNAVLPILACGLLTGDALTIRRVPDLTDVETLGAILRDCGVLIQKEGSTWTLSAPQPQSPGNEAAMRQMRASVLVMGPLLARTGEAVVSLPGGCAIGQRPIDLHLKGMQALGAQVEQTQGAVILRGKLRGAHVYLDLPSVGATENLLMAAVLAQGVTRIENAAKEPEIADLAGCLMAMGAKIRGAGTSTIWVEGVAKLHGAEYEPIPDRIEAGTLICAAASLPGTVLVRGARADHMRAVLFKLMESGVRFRETPGGLFVRGRAQAPLQIRTLAYPGFPTDLQAPMMVVSLTTPGTSIFLETIFENRFMHAQELQRMGARIRVENRAAIVEGGHPLEGAPVTSTDLRAGAALVLAGLLARGETVLNDPTGHIRRGYAALPGQLRQLGAQVEEIE